ncbi:MAG: hypothetical protein ACOYMN_00720 [Roseimicrobium sp.]
MNAPAITLPSGNDFADWLSPILVKELRQGLKTRVFVSTFIVIQMVMILLTGLQLLSMAGGADRGVMGAFDGFFWAFVWLPLLVLMPFRGLTAVSEEVKANTLDLVQLTRLTSFRIVLGKWLALVAQTLLLVAAILPYAVLRYFFGEVDVVSDVTTIGYLLLSSFTLTAGAIALSSAPLAVRILALAVGLPTLLIAAASISAMAAFSGRSSSSFFSPPDWVIWGVQILMTGMYLCLLLEIAAARIAPISENHAVRKRLIALGAALLSYILPLGLYQEDVIQNWLLSAAVVWGWATVEALTERTVLVPRVYHAFARRGLLGRLAGRVLYPGWASGFVFACLLMVLVFGVFSLYGGVTNYASFAVSFVLGFTAVVAPVIVLLAFKKAKQPIWIYLLVQALCGLVFIIANIIAHFPNTREVDVMQWLAPIPMSALLALLASSEASVLLENTSAVSLLVCACVLGYLAIRAAMEFRVIAKLERDSLHQS